MSIHRRKVQLYLSGALLLLLAFLRQQNLAGVHGSGALQKIQRFNDTSPIPLLQESRWKSLGHSRISHDSLAAQIRPNFVEKQESEYTRVLVVPRMDDDDTSWLARELPNLNTTVYVANNPSASLHPPKNKGHEVMVYLTFIIDHYDKLPDIIIFMHAHRWTHHNNELLDNDALEMITRLSSTHVFRHGYVNMRCRWMPGCPEWLHPGSREENMSKQEEAVVLHSWNELFPSHPLPKTLAQPCCAQFALSRQRVHSIPLSQFTFYRDWILRTPLSDYISGRIWEYSWQYLFTNQSVSCPAEHLCYCGAFGVCFGGPTEYNNYEDMRRTKLDYEAQLEELRRPQESLSHVPDEHSSVKSGELSYLHGQVSALDKEMVARRNDAIDRGNDPRKRAAECDQ